MGPQIVIEKLETEDSRKRIRLSNEIVIDKLETKDSRKRIRLSNESVDGICEAENYINTSRLQLESQCDNTINNIIPREVLVEIFSYLSRKELLLSAALVCKYWKTKTEDSQLWRRLDLKSFKEITTEKVKQLLSLSKGIVYIDLQGCRLIDNSVISEISKQRRLRTLTLSRCHQLSDKIFRSIANCRLLQHLVLRNLNTLTDKALEMIAKSCTNLTALDISRCNEVTTTGLLSVLQHCNKMKSWKLHRCSKVSDDFLMELAIKSPQTEILGISTCEFTADGLRHILKLPKLIEISAWSLNMSDDLVSIMSNMKHLDLLKCPNITNDGISAIVRNNPKLECLAVSADGIDDTALEMISKSSCRFTLESLAIPYCEVSKHGIRRILQNCPKLSSMLITDIKKKTVKRLRSEYPNVDINAY